MLLNWSSPDMCFRTLKILLSLRFPIYFRISGSQLESRLYQKVPFPNCRADSASFRDAILCLVVALVSFFAGLKKMLSLM
jgi:hypothetical protein